MKKEGTAVDVRAEGHMRGEIRRARASGIMDEEKYEERCREKA